MHACARRYERVTSKMYFSLLLPTAFAFGADILADFELAEIGISPDNWAQDDFSFLTSMSMMLLDTLLCAPDPHARHRHECACHQLMHVCMCIPPTPHAHHAHARP